MPDRRSTEWTEHGRQLLRLVLAAFDRMIGPQLDDLAVTGRIFTAPCGNEVGGRSPVVERPWPPVSVP